MKSLKHLLLLLSLCLFATSSFAQMTEDPTKWTYEVKKKSATEYRLIFHLDLKEGWHIWSLHPGGDGYQIVPSFTLDKNARVKLAGTPVEKGKSTTTIMDGVDGKVTYLSGKVDYTMDIITTGPVKITGKHTYQVCDNKMCLAPKDKEFAIEIK